MANGEDSCLGGGKSNEERIIEAQQHKEAIKATKDNTQEIKSLKQMIADQRKKEKGQPSSYEKTLLKYISALDKKVGAVKTNQLMIGKSGKELSGTALLARLEKHLGLIGSKAPKTKPAKVVKQPTVKTPKSTALSLDDLKTNTLRKKHKGLVSYLAGNVDDSLIQSYLNDTSQLSVDKLEQIKKDYLESKKPVKVVPPPKPPKIPKPPKTLKRDLPFDVLQQLKFDESQKNKAISLINKLTTEIGQSAVNEIIYFKDGTLKPYSVIIQAIEGKLKAIKDLKKQQTKQDNTPLVTPKSLSDKILESSKKREEANLNRFGQWFIQEKGIDAYQSLTAGKSDDEVLDVLRQLLVETKLQRANEAYSKKMQKENERSQKEAEKEQKKLIRLQEKQAREQEKRHKELLRSLKKRGGMLGGMGFMMASVLGSTLSPLINMLAPLAALFAGYKALKGDFGSFEDTKESLTNLVPDFIKDMIPDSVKQSVSDYTDGIGSRMSEYGTVATAGAGFSALKGAGGMLVNTNTGKKLTTKLRNKFKPPKNKLLNTALNVGKKVGKFGLNASKLPGFLLGKMPGLGRLGLAIPGLNWVLGGYALGKGAYNAWQDTDNWKDFAIETGYNTLGELGGIASGGIVDPELIKKGAKSLTDMALGTDMSNISSKDKRAVSNKIDDIIDNEKQKDIEKYKKEFLSKYKASYGRGHGKKHGPQSDRNTALQKYIDTKMGSKEYKEGLRERVAERYSQPTISKSENVIDERNGIIDSISTQLQNIQNSINTNKQTNTTSTSSTSTTNNFYGNQTQNSVTSSMAFGSASYYANSLFGD